MRSLMLSLQPCRRPLWILGARRALKGAGFAFLWKFVEASGIRPRQQGEVLTSKLTLFQVAHVILSIFPFASVSRFITAMSWACTVCSRCHCNRQREKSAVNRLSHFGDKYGLFALGHHFRLSPRAF